MPGTSSSGWPFFFYLYYIHVSWPPLLSLCLFLLLAISFLIFPAPGGTFLKIGNYSVAKKTVKTQRSVCFGSIPCVPRGCVLSVNIAGSGPSSLLRRGGGRVA